MRKDITKFLHEILAGVPHQVLAARDVGTARSFTVFHPLLTVAEAALASSTHSEALPPLFRVAEHPRRIRMLDTALAEVLIRCDHVLVEPTLPQEAVNGRWRLPRR